RALLHVTPITLFFTLFYSIHTPTPEIYTLSYTTLFRSYKTEDFVDRVHEITDGHGADIILVVVAGRYSEDNLRAIANRGRWVIIGTAGGIKGPINFLRVMAKQAVITGNLLRPRTAQEKGEILAGVVEHIWPLVANDEIDPLIAQTFKLENTNVAYQRFAES